MESNSARDDDQVPKRANLHHFPATQSEKGRAAVPPGFHLKILPAEFFPQLLGFTKQSFFPPLSHLILHKVALGATLFSPSLPCFHGCAGG